MKRIRFFVRGFSAASAFLVLANGGRFSSANALNCALVFVAMATVLKAGAWRLSLSRVVQQSMLVNHDWLRHPWSAMPVRLRPQMS